METNRTEFVLAGDYNIDLLKLNQIDIIHQIFESLSSISVYPKITLPTRFLNLNGSLIDNFFVNYPQHHWKLQLVY